MKKARALVALVLLLAMVLVGCQPAAETVKIGALFAVTGGAALLGAPEANTAQMVIEQINEAGGVDGHQIELVLRDTAGDAATAVSMARQLIEEEGVIAIIGPTTSGETLQVMGICNDAGVPLLSCAASEQIVNPVLPFVFKTPQKDSYVAELIYRTMNRMNISNIAVVASNTGFGNGGIAQLTALAPQYGMNFTLPPEQYDKAATDLTDLMTRVNTTNPQAIVNWSIEPAQSIVLVNMAQLGMTAVRFQSHGFGNPQFVSNAGSAAEGVIFPAGRLLVADSLPADHPQRAVLIAYRDAYETRFNEPVSTFGGHAYDAIMILRQAIIDAGSVDRVAIRDAIENIQGFVGTGGIFNFSATDHNGLLIDSLEMLTVRNGQFALYQGQ